jgi:hypothetical protein
MNPGERRRDDDLHTVDILDEDAQLLDVEDGLLDRLVHLPVAGDDGLSHRCLVSRHV